MAGTKQGIPQALKELWFVTLGALSLSVEEIPKTVEEFVRRGSLSRKEARKLVAQLTDRVNRNRKVLEKKIETNVTRAVRQLKFPSRDEIQGLVKRVTKLGQQVAQVMDSKPEVRRSPASAGGKSSRRRQRAR